MVKRKFIEAKNFKDSKYTKKWKDCIDAYKGDYFKKNLPEYKSQEISNYIFSTIETIRPLMCANRPKILSMPHTPKGQELAPKIQMALSSEWERENMQVKLSKAILMSLQIGSAVFFIPWDSKDKNIGNVKVKLISPFNCFPDPLATSLEDCRYFIYATYKDVGLLSTKYPEKAEQILQQAGTPSEEDLIQGRENAVGENGQVLYIECYMEDYTVLTKEEEIDGKKLKKITRKYPNKRVIKLAGDILLEDKNCPYNDKEYPFEILKCYDIPNEFWGMGEVEQILSPQTYANSIMNYILDVAHLTANSPWIVDTNAGIERGKLTNRPGLVIRKRPGTEVRREQPAQLPGYVQNIIDILKRDIEVITGVFDITRGERPANITAAAAIQALSENAQNRIALKIQMMEYCLGRLGAKWLSRIRQYWTTKRNIYVMGKDLKAKQDEISGLEIDGEYDIVIVGGSTMPVNKTARLQQMVQLAQTKAEDGLPIVDRKTVLQHSDLIDAEQICARFEMMKQQQRMQQMQTAQMEQQKFQADMQMRQQEFETEVQLKLAELEAEKEKMKMDRLEAIVNKQIPVDLLLQLLDFLPPYLVKQIVDEYPELEFIINETSSNEERRNLEQVVDQGQDIP